MHSEFNTKRLRVSLGFVFLLIATNLLHAQSEEEVMLDKEESSARWYFSVGVNAIDDSGNKASSLFDISKAWNVVPYPSRVGIGRSFRKGFSIELIGTYNKYKKGKIVDFVDIGENINYFSVDSRVTYDVTTIFGKKGWFDPYLGIGLGYANANKVIRGTFNTVVGFRIWMCRDLAFDFNSSGKFALGSNVLATNHLQHAVALIIRLNRSKNEKDDL